MLFLISTIGKIAPVFIALSIPISYACAKHQGIKAKKQKYSSRTYSNPFYATNRMEPTCGHNPNHLAESSPTALDYTAIWTPTTQLSTQRCIYIYCVNSFKNTRRSLSIHISIVCGAMQCLSIFWKFFEKNILSDLSIGVSQNVNPRSHDNNYFLTIPACF